jgi:hypothetical protein
MKRKKSATKKRRSVSRSFNIRGSVTPRRKRRKSMNEGTTLAELFNPATAKAGAKVIGAGAIGGLIAGGVSRILSKQKPITRYGVEIAASFATYALLGYPSMSAGMAGAFASQEFAPVYSKFLNEDDVMFADDDSINELPIMMNEDGETITLQEDGSGNMVYLNEATGETTLAEDVFLQEDTFLQVGEDSIYPSYDTQYS